MSRLNAFDRGISRPYSSLLFDGLANISTHVLEQETSSAGLFDIRRYGQTPRLVIYTIFEGTQRDPALGDQPRHLRPAQRVADESFKWHVDRGVTREGPVSNECMGPFGRISPPFPPVDDTVQPPADAGARRRGRAAVRTVADLSVVAVVAALVVALAAVLLVVVAVVVVAVVAIAVVVGAGAAGLVALLVTLELVVAVRSGRGRRHCR